MFEKLVEFQKLRVVLILPVDPLIFTRSPANQELPSKLVVHGNELRVFRPGPCNYFLDVLYMDPMQ